MTAMQRGLLNILAIALACGEFSHRRKASASIKEHNKTCTR